MNEKSQVSGKNVSEQYLFFHEHRRVYCVYTRNLGACLCLLSHPITVSQCYVMDEDAALEAQAPEGSSPEGELTGKPYSSNSIAGTNS